MPSTSLWAQKLMCQARVRRADVVDSKAGLVYDGTRQNPPTKVWGRLPQSGSAEVYAYAACENGSLVADIIRKDKGHTEGLEPNITEEIVKLMLSATK